MNMQVKQKLQKEKIYLAFSLGLLVCLFAAYVYFLSASVIHVVIRKELNKETQNLSTRISQLESRYIERQHSISNEIASRDGFVEVTDKIFINRTTTSLVLSSNNLR